MSQVLKCRQSCVLIWNARHQLILNSAVLAKVKNGHSLSAGALQFFNSLTDVNQLRLASLMLSLRGLQAIVPIF